MSPISLLDAFDLSATPRIAIVGAGGKTSLLFRLARALPPPLLVSNSAHLAVEQGRYADRVITVAEAGDLPAEPGGLSTGVTLLTGPADERGRTRGLEDALLAEVVRRADGANLPLLIEADGSRGRPLKAPAAWEPPIPAFVETVVVVVGLSGLGQPLTDAWVYRPEDFGRLAGLSPGSAVDSAALAGVLLHPQGGLKNIPGPARRVALLNQADSPELLDEAALLARRLLGGYARVVVASLHGPGGEAPPAQVHAVHRPVGGIVLAAGASRRLGQPKQLLTWQGEPLVRRQARIALEAGLDPVIVVCGAHAPEVTAALAGLKIRVVTNGRWSEGQSSSLKAGLAALPTGNGAAVFLLADQPFIQADLIGELVALHAQTLSPVVAPRVGERRANPVLFDRRTFADLAQLQGDAGGRQVIGKWGMAFVDWPDERLLLDIDSLEDYRRAVERS